MADGLGLGLVGLGLGCCTNNKIW